MWNVEDRISNTFTPFPPFSSVAVEVGASLADRLDEGTASFSLVVVDLGGIFYRCCRTVKRLRVRVRGREGNEY